ncbi:DNA-protecting protein DprA [Shewanella seohaensis]|uniref:DNA-processing protein DprA n=1 Tax=Shewanella seohaensis TaxID=755175 RepID=UPI00200DF8FD|nr:DNA-processing protein DprA [Shewanella seohaensis]MCL1121202.1 DNA-protecting protein DprA [Shewanella seohaensis]UXM80692.1 DNA-protecting protein DprA [Shewanella seohaensis]
MSTDYLARAKAVFCVACQTRNLTTDAILMKLLKLSDSLDLRDELDWITFVNSTSHFKELFSTSFIRENSDLYETHLDFSIKPILFGSELYPNSLALISQPPPVMYFKGDEDVLNELPGIAIVGSREISTAGAEITRRITTQCVKAGLVVVSGLAIGVDASAHRATLQANGRTIAVLANGLDQVKPRQNQKLGDEILDSGGAWISEVPIGSKVFKNSFVQRNRIQVGLAASSVLVEAALGSGTMTQADFCFKANRPMFAVVPHKDGNPLGLNCEGTQSLVNEGKAIPLKTKDDYEQLIKVTLESRSFLQGYGKIGQNISMSF